MYGTAEELSDLPTLMNNLLSSAATFRGHPDGAGTARLLEAAAQALQQQLAETKVRRRRRRRRHAQSRGSRDPSPCAAPRAPRVHRTLSRSPAPAGTSPRPPPACCQVQRGLAIASQTLASELSIKCERLQARLEPHAPAGANGAALHHPPPTPMATPLGGGGACAQCSYPAGGYGVGAGAASPACSLQPQPLQTPAALQSQQLQQLQAPQT